VVASFDGFSMERQLTLPNAEASSASAEYQDGVLTITLKKAPPVEAVSIAVRSTPATDAEDDEPKDDEAAKPYTLNLAAPGVKASDIHVEVSQGELSIRGETGARGGTYRVNRKFTLPRDANATKAIATHIDGLLTIELPVQAPAVTAIKISAPVDAHGPNKGAASEQSVRLPQAGTDSTAEPAPKGDATDEWPAEWDMMLDDLAEMGFEDRESREMLAKHSGSLNATVKELISRRRAAK